MLPAGHVFIRACAEHDAEYDARRAGKLDEDTSTPADKRFLRYMLDIAGSSWKLKCLAYFLYSIARAWGRVRWPSPEVLR